MKKIFLFICAALMSVGMLAEEATVSPFTLTPSEAAPVFFSATDIDNGQWTMDNG